MFEMPSTTTTTLPPHPPSRPKYAPSLRSIKINVYMPAREEVIWNASLIIYATKSALLSLAALTFALSELTQPQINGRGKKKNMHEAWIKKKM